MGAVLLAPIFIEETYERHQMDGKQGAIKQLFQSVAKM